MADGDVLSLLLMRIPQLGIIEEGVGAKLNAKLLLPQVIQDCSVEQGRHEDHLVEAKELLWGEVTGNQKD